MPQGRRMYRNEISFDLAIRFCTEGALLILPKTEHAPRLSQNTLHPIRDNIRIKPGAQIVPQAPVPR